MPSVQIKNVPDDVHLTLRRRAVVEGQSLQEYLLALITSQAREPTLDEVLDRIAARSGSHFPPGEIVRGIRTDRDSR